MQKRKKSWTRNKQQSANTSEVHKVFNISSLKAFVAENYPTGSPLQVVLVDEKDVMSAEDFLANRLYGSSSASL
jgi:hypothetical protein